MAGLDVDEVLLFKLTLKERDGEYTNFTELAEDGVW
jgi:hypothetical protein